MRRINEWSFPSELEDTSRFEPAGSYDYAITAIVNKVIMRGERRFFGLLPGKKFLQIDVAMDFNNDDDIGYRIYLYNCADDLDPGYCRLLEKALEQEGLYLVRANLCVPDPEWSRQHTDQFRSSDLDEVPYTLEALALMPEQRLFLGLGSGCLYREKRKE